MEQRHDVVVIGAGASGLTVAVGLTSAGKQVLLVERDRIGGECTWSGCVPSKALLHQAKRGGIRGTAALKYVKNMIAEVARTETAEHFKDRGITVLKGEARFTGPDSFEVNGATHHFKTAVIATGSKARTLSIPGLSFDQVLTNESFFLQDSLPNELLIIGGGPVGLELGQASALLGSRVTIVDQAETFAPHEDPAVAAVLRKRFEELNITLHLGARVEKAAEHTATIVTADGRNVECSFSKVLQAVGRTPSFPLGLSEAEIETVSEGIITDHNYRTTNPHVFALGDVTLEPRFTHAADEAARQLVKHLVSRRALPVTRGKALPKVTYTDPELAHVGMSEAAAVARYGARGIRRIELPLSAADRAITDGAEGVAVVIVKRLSGRVLGAHLAGPRAGELVGYFTLAIDRKLSLGTLAKSIYAYPTYAQIIRKLNDANIREQVQTWQSDLAYWLVRHAALIGAIILWGSFLIYLAHYKEANGMTLYEILVMLFSFFNDSVWGPLVFMLAYAFRPITFFPGTGMSVLAGIFFGFWWGMLYTIIAANVSANIAYGIGRFFGHHLSVADTSLRNWVQPIYQKPFISILFMRLFFFPFDGVGFFSGAIKAGWMSFASATFVGTLLGIMTFVSLGASINIEILMDEGVTTAAFDPTYVVFAVLIFLFTLGLSKILRRYERSKKRSSAEVSSNR